MSRDLTPWRTSVPPADVTIRKADGSVETRKGHYFTEFDYQAYLLTGHWQTLRRQALKRDRNRCAQCEARFTTLHVHHLTYERLGEELLADLVTLCEPCHDAWHREDPLSGRTPIP